MSLPDTLERVGIVVGSSFLLSLPASALSILLFGVSGSPPLLLYLSFVPGAIVGLLVVAGTLTVTYHQIWKFSITSYVLALGGRWFVESGAAASNDLLAVGWWLLAVAVGVGVARVRFREFLSKEVESATRNS